MADKITLTNIATGLGSTNDINANFAAIVTAFNTCFWRDGTGDNAVESDMDMNSNRILNLPAPVNPTEPLRLADIASLGGLNIGDMVVPGTTVVNNVPVWGDTTGTTLSNSILSVDSAGVNIIVTTSAVTNADMYTEKATGDLGSLRQYGRNDAAEYVNYGAITFVSEDDTDGSERGRMDFKTMIGGTLNTQMILQNASTNVVECDLYSIDNCNWSLNTQRDGDGESIGFIQFKGLSDTAANVTYGQIVGVIQDASNGTEDGKFNMRLIDAGTIATRKQWFTDAGTFYNYNYATANIACYHTSDRSTGNLMVEWFQGQDSGANSTNYAKRYVAIVDNTDTSEDGKMVWATVTAGTLADRLSLGGGLWGAGATGGDPGAGKANFTEVQDDGAVLTCYVADAYLDGTVDIAAWDARVPDREHTAEVEIIYKDVEEEVITEVKEPLALGLELVREVREKVVRKVPAGERVVKEAYTEVTEHEGARKFAARLGGPEDPMDIEKAERHFRTKKHLTSFPNRNGYQKMGVGKWAQRCVEAIELVAVWCFQHNARIKKLEKHIDTLQKEVDALKGNPNG